MNFLCVECGVLMDGAKPHQPWCPHYVREDMAKRYTLWGGLWRSLAVTLAALAIIMALCLWLATLIGGSWVWVIPVVATLALVANWTQDRFPT